MPSGNTGSFTLTVSVAGRSYWSGLQAPPQLAVSVEAITPDSTPVTGNLGTLTAYPTVAGGPAVAKLLPVHSDRQAPTSGWCWSPMTPRQSFTCARAPESPPGQPPLTGSTMGIWSPQISAGPPSCRRPCTAGTYTIEATTYAPGESGSFTLTASGGADLAATLSRLEPERSGVRVRHRGRAGRQPDLLHHRRATHLQPRHRNRLLVVRGPRLPF